MDTKELLSVAVSALAALVLPGSTCKSTQWVQHLDTDVSLQPAEVFTRSFKLDAGHLFRFEWEVKEPAGAEVYIRFLDEGNYAKCLAQQAYDAVYENSGPSGSHEGRIAATEDHTLVLENEGADAIVTYAHLETRF